MGGDTGRGVPADQQHAAVRQGRRCGVVARHERGRGDGPCSGDGVEDFGVGDLAATGEAAGDEHPPIAQARCRVGVAPELHRAGGGEGVRLRIVDLRGVEAHAAIARAAGDEHAPIGQAGHAREAAPAAHRRCGPGAGGDLEHVDLGCAVAGHEHLAVGQQLRIRDVPGHAVRSERGPCARRRIQHVGAVHEAVPVDTCDRQDATIAEQHAAELPTLDRHRRDRSPGVGQGLLRAREGLLGRVIVAAGVQHTQE